MMEEALPMQSAYGLGPCHGAETRLLCPTSNDNTSWAVQVKRPGRCAVSMQGKTPLSQMSPKTEGGLRHTTMMLDKMEGLAKYKVPGGKLLTIKVGYSSKIESIQILGDFFLYPESSLQLIEHSLIGAEIDSTLNQLSSKIAQVVIKNGIEMIGMTPDSIAQTILMAVKK